MSRVIKKVVLAYSGGLDTSVILKWLQETYSCEVIAFCADLGQGEDLQAIKAKAQKLGVKKIYVEDLRETFVKDYVFPMLRGNAVYEGCYLLGTSIARPLIARRQAEIALKEGAEAVSHGSTGKGNDQVRFELTYTALAPNLKIIAPWREWTMRSRRELIEYADRHGIPVTATKAKPYSMDLNLFHVSYEGGILEDPWEAPPGEIFQMTVSPEQAPEHEPWVVGLADALRQDDTAAYVIVLDDEGEERIRAAYPGATWGRLAEAKRRYDPTNLFRMNQNIPPG